MRYAASVFGGSRNQRLKFRGLVSDASGSAVPGAEIKATQTDTGTVRTVISEDDGTYVLANLPIGPYRLEVSKQGFSTYVQTGIVLQVATNPTIDMALKVGAVNEQVQVEANAVQVETEATGVGNVMENRRILELPLNGRLATDLIQLTGAVITQGVAGAGGFPNTGNLVVAGGQSNGVGYLLDGSLFNNPWDNANMPFPFPDALQEFKVETSALTAQNGMHAGASITAVTKSGSNSFHGDAFDFFRNGDLNARNFFAPTRDTLKRNQYGGTIGGPIMKNKLFFFFGYQGTRTRQDPSSTNAFVPTPAMLAGDFSGLPDGDSGGARQPVHATARFRPRCIDPAAVKLAQALPPTTGPCGNTSYGLVTKINEGQFVARVDYQISEKQSLFARYTTTAYLRPPSYTLHAQQPSFHRPGRFRRPGAVLDCGRHLFVQPHHGECVPRGVGPDRGPPRECGFFFGLRSGRADVLRIPAAPELLFGDQRFQRRRFDRNPWHQPQQHIPTHQRCDAGARQAPDHAGRKRGQLPDGVLRHRLRTESVHLPQPARFSAGTIQLQRDLHSQRFDSGKIFRRGLRGRYLEGDAEADGQPWSALGAFPASPDEEWRDL